MSLMGPTHKACLTGAQHVNATVVWCSLQFVVLSVSQQRGPCCLLPISHAAQCMSQHLQVVYVHCCPSWLATTPAFQQMLHSCTAAQLPCQGCLPGSDGWQALNAQLISLVFSFGPVCPRVAAFADCNRGMGDSRPSEIIIPV